MIDGDIPVTPSRSGDLDGREVPSQFRNLDGGGQRRGQENGGRPLAILNDDIPQDRPLVAIKTGGLNVGDGRAVRHFLKTRLEACEPSTVTAICKIWEVDMTKSGDGLNEDGDAPVVDRLVNTLFTSGERTQKLAVETRKSLTTLFDTRGLKRKVKDATNVSEVLGVATRRASPNHGMMS